MLIYHEVLQSLLSLKQQSDRTTTRLHNYAVSLRQTPKTTHMSAVATESNYKVKDIKLAAWGRKEIQA